MNEATGAEIFTVGDVFSNDQEDPATIAARKMDWQTLLARLPAREQAIVVYLLAGRTVAEVAVAFRLSRSTLQLSKNRLADLVLGFMGADILIEVRRQPGWRNDLNTTRERMACRHDRRN